MKERQRKKIVGKLGEISSDVFGETLYIRPFGEDDRLITKIARETGEKKSAVAQKLLRLALQSGEFDFPDDKKLAEKLDWLINNAKHEAARRDVSEALFERLEEHSRELEKTLSEIKLNSRATRILASEIYCAASVCVSYLNQIFTKIIEYFSPVEIERKLSIDFANRNIAGLIEHSINELENLCEHHDIDSESAHAPETLYLFTKIERIKAKLQAALKD